MEENGKDDLLSPAERNAFKRLENGQKKVVRFESTKVDSFEVEEVTPEAPQEASRSSRSNRSSRSTGSAGGSTKRFMASPAAALKTGMTVAQNGIRNFGSSMAHRVSRTFLSDDYVILGHWWKFNEILDPRSSVVRNWQLIFVTSCMVGTFVDPLFFYLPFVRNDYNNENKSLLCVDNQMSLAVAVTVLRTMVDALYLMHIFMQFRIAYIARSSRIFGRGELVVDPKMIRARYMSKYFWLDVITVLPLPQVTLWGVIGQLKGTTPTKQKNAVRYLILIQFFPRLFRVFPLVNEMQRHSGIIMTTAWAGAFLNIIVYLLTSHVIGSVYYLLAVERTDHCWRTQCNMNQTCLSYLDCNKIHDPNRTTWVNTNGTNIALQCTPNNPNSTSDFDFGIFESAMTHVVSQKRFFKRYYWTLWWGLQTLSSLGQSLNPSVFFWEIFFCLTIGILGLTFLALLIGNIQTYLSSLTVRLEKMRLKRRDTEKWMHHRNMPQELRERVRSYNQFVWVATNGVEEEELMSEWPTDLRRDIKRHLCLDLVRKVPLFADMDYSLLDAICDKLRPALFTDGSLVLREDDPVPCMFFIIRGRLDTSMATNGAGFFIMGSLEPGSFCGDELLTWALDPNPKEALPISSRTIQACTEVEAFALLAGDLKDVAAQYRRLHSRQLQHVFRFHSHQWRTWAACCIQAAWRRYWRRKQRMLAEEMEDLYVMNSPTYAQSGFAGELPPWQSQQLRKPSEPDFGKFGFGQAAEDDMHEEEYGDYSPTGATPRVGNNRARNRFATRSGPLDMRGNPVRSNHVRSSGPLDSTGAPRNQRWSGVLSYDYEPSHVGFTGPL